MQEDPLNGLVLVSLEILKEIHSNPTEALSQIRINYFGPLYILSINSSKENFRQLIEFGATDIIDVSDLSAVRSIFNTYSLFHQMSRTQRTLIALVVEDSASQQDLITSVLEEKNVKTYVVPSVREALTVLKFDKIDLIITDVHLIGDFTGMHLLREICQSTHWQGIPTFVISGVVPNGSLKEYFQLGVRDFMFKPLDIDLFSLRIDNVIRERQTFLELQEEKNKLREIAYIDTLTGLYNRAHLKKIFELWSSNEGHQFYAFMLDIDNLKQVNAEVGHDAGDYALHSVALCLKENMSSSDVVIRLGGDEFIGLLSIKEEFDIKNYISRLLELINKIQNPGNVVIHASIGVVKIDASLDLINLLRRCDAVMYAAKDSGYNTIEYDF
jgi:diguanylate cyclase (GGDEF)-like protein